MHSSKSESWEWRMEKQEGKCSVGVHILKTRSLRILFIDCGHKCVLSKMITSHIDPVCCTSHTVWNPTLHTFPISLNMYHNINCSDCSTWDLQDYSLWTWFVLVFVDWFCLFDTCKLDLCLTVHNQCRYGNIEKPTRCNNKNLLISKISSTCFGQSFVHLQERKTEIYSIWYSVLLLR
jgi:hypothetical protein